MDLSGSVALDLDAADLQVTPCRHCPDWWAEVVPGRMVLVREWHRADCPVAGELAEPGSLRGSPDEISTELLATGVLVGLYGLSPDAASTVLRLRASLLSMAVDQLAAGVVAAMSALEVEPETRSRASSLLDRIGA